MRYARLKGRYFDGVSSKPHSVDIILKDSILEIIDSVDQISITYWQRDEISLLTDPSHFRQIKLTNHIEAPESRLIFTDPDAKDTVLSWLPSSASALKIQVNATSIVGYFILTGTILYAAYVILPVLTSSLIGLVPQSFEKSIGDNYIEMLKKQYPTCITENTPAGAAINTITTTLSAPIPHQMPYKITVLKSSQVNAFALPGNHILLMDGMLQAADKPQQITAVLAHEMAHIEHRHAFQTLIQGQILTMLFNFVLDTGGTIDASKIADIANLHSNREHEYDADGFAANLLYTASIDPHATIELMGLLADEENGLKEIYEHIPEFLLTHPDTDKRIQQLTDQIANMPTKRLAPSILDNKQWQDLKHACKNTTGEAGNVIEDLLKNYEEKKKTHNKKSDSTTLQNEVK